MLEELRGLADVVENIRNAIDEDAPEALESLLATYGQYAQVLSAEGQHRYLADDNFSLKAITLKLQQRLNQQKNGDKAKLSEQSLAILIDHLPMNRHVAAQVMKFYPAAIAQMARMLFLNPYSIANGFDNTDHASAKIIEALSDHAPEMAQAIITRVIKVVPVHMIGSEFVSTILTALPKLGPLDSEIRTAIHERKKLFLSTLAYMVDIGEGELSNLPLIAKVHELALPELISTLLHPNHMRTFEESHKEGLTALLHIDLPFDSETLDDSLALDQRKYGKTPSLVTTLYLSSSVLSIYDLSKALEKRWKAEPDRREATYMMISKSVKLLKSMGLYNEQRACTLIEDLFLSIPEHELDEGNACREFSKHLPEDLIRASSLIQNPVMARECLELDLGL
jgi:hypothetical protein